MPVIQFFYELGRAKGLKIVHLNIRSLLPKIEHIRSILSQYNIDILTISETWLNSKIDIKLISVPSYTLLRQDRYKGDAKTRVGGLISYIAQGKSMQVTELLEDSVCNKNLEAHWFHITMPNSRNIFICNTYRPPAGKVEPALYALNKSIMSKNLQRNDIFILGDFNINYKNKNSPNFKKLAFSESSNSLKQVIHRATRVSHKNNSILDLILTNSKYISGAGTLDTFISDHQPIFILKKKTKSQAEEIKFSGRAYKNLNEEDFINNLKKSNWDKLHEATDVNNQ